ncbi:thioesterase II family protein [Labedaea rhizosphaerae]|uniref:Surfactin synthase thioesterase subunit n=1 Tax=Labedaea rhizosphaerae TaxID=598644 RepID=A0A4R6S5P9_LABRH|nr:alpha/beta fold hydrolase [Labedaea rhizosphaerae]TDP95159.1 surfactin synthase thioesterase subunit [Labedaea rhizosphaerae]
MTWFATRGAAAETAVAQLFCLPFAGGAAAAFRQWSPELPASIELLPVQLPGRERRLAEDPDFAIADLAEAIVRRADRPFGIYGHSMGGRVAFEVVRELRRTGAPLPVLLAVGGSRAPHLPLTGALSGVSALPDDEMFTALTEAGGTPAELLEHRELMTLFAPMIRADFRRLDEYVFTDEPPLPVPIIAFHGTSDDLVEIEDVVAWERHTSAGFTLHEVPGGHFFLREGHRARLLEPLAKRLLELS